MNWWLIALAFVIAVAVLIALIAIEYRLGQLVDLKQAQLRADHLRHIDK